MFKILFLAKTMLAPGIRRIFSARDVFFHDGVMMRRVHVTTRMQSVVAAVMIGGLGLAASGTAHIAGATPMIAAAVSRNAEVSMLASKVATMQSEMAQIRAAAIAHAARLEQRQAFLSAILTGKGRLVLPTSTDGAVSAAAAPVIAPFKNVEGQQSALAAAAAALVDARYVEAAASLRKLGVAPEQLHGGGLAMGGPYEPVSSAPTTTQPDPTFRALFQSWKRLDQLQQGMIAIPSQRPVDVVVFTSGFGVRSDPFRGGAAMHAGVDIPGPYGSTIYATADGIVARTEWAGGYGNLVEIDHGRGIQTRYGHLSASLVSPGQRVKRGQPIARMGSTGRSTGTHLHYEVRLDGHAVNPMPFLTSANYLASMQTRAPGIAAAAQGGPEQ